MYTDMINTVPKAVFDVNQRMQALQELGMLPQLNMDLVGSRLQVAKQLFNELSTYAEHRTAGKEGTSSIDCVLVNISVHIPIVL